MRKPEVVRAALVDAAWQLAGKGADLTWRDVVANVRLGRGWQDVLPASSVWSWAGPK